MDDVDAMTAQGEYGRPTTAGEKAAVGLATIVLLPLWIAGALLPFAIIWLFIGHPGA